MTIGLVAGFKLFGNRVYSADCICEKGMLGPMSPKRVL